MEAAVNVESLNDNRRMVARWLAFTVWAAVAAGAVFWALRLFVHPTPAPAHATLAVPVTVATADLSRLLGADAPPEESEEPEPVSDERFELIGVVAPREGRAAAEGLALIAVDGNPPRAYRVGARVDGEQVLQAVRPRGALLGPPGGAVQVTLEIPPPAPASTGTLPPATSAPPAGTAPRLSPAMPSARAMPSTRTMPPGARIARPQPAPAADSEPAEGPQDGEGSDGGGASLPSR